MPAHKPALLCSFALSWPLTGCTRAQPPAQPPATSPAPTATPPSAEPAATTASPLAHAAAALEGTWNCRGSVAGPEGPSPSSVTVTARPALDSTWLETHFVVTSGKYPYEFTAYRTFEASSGSWVSLIVDNLGGHALSRSTDGVLFAGTSTSPMGTLSIRDSELLRSPHELTLLGQYSLDAGASWNTGYELACVR